MLAVPPKVPRSVITPFCQRKAWVVCEEVVLRPTTAPDRLMPSATLKPPPRVPRSVIAPFCQRTACSAPEAVVVSPTTCPKSLMPKASARSNVPPNVPRSVIAPFWIRDEVPIPIRATETRGDEPDTATAAANAPITISPTPTNASRRFTVIAPEPPESRKERETGIDTFRDKPIIPQQRAPGQFQGGIQVWQFDADLERLTPARRMLRRDLLAP